MTMLTRSTHEAAQLLGCSERWLIEKLRDNRLPGRKLGRHWRLTDQDIEDALALCGNGARKDVTATRREGSGLTATSRKRAVIGGSASGLSSGQKSYD
jgi:excisionase family DNA binding protein